MDPNGKIDKALKAAKIHYQSRRLAPAEILCRLVLESRPNDSRALELLGCISQRIGKLDHAAACFRAATAASPKHRSIRMRLAKVEAPKLDAAKTPNRRGHDERRYLLIKAWGYGFFSDVSHVLGSLMLAEMTGRTPIVYWGRNSLFGDDGTQNAFTHFFCPHNKTTIDDLTGFGRSDYFPPKWFKQNLRDENVQKWQGRHSRMAGLYFFNRPERVAVSDFFISIPELVLWLEKDDPYNGASLEHVFSQLIQKYLRPRAAITATVDDFHTQHLSEAPFIAAHVRGSDKVNEQPNLNEINEAYFTTLDRMTEGTGERIFLLTDSDPIVSAFRAHYGDRVVIADARRTAKQIGVHYQAWDDRVSLGFEVMKDVYLAARAKRFVGNGLTNPSCMIAHLKNWPSGDCVLLVPNFQHRRNHFIHFCPAPRQAPM